jgi:hypothetical protein
VCIEELDLFMNDGAKRLFINTHGKNKEDFSPEFIALMEFIEYNQSKDTEIKNDNLKRIINRVSQIKSSEKVGVRYMQRWEEEALIRHEGKEEGIHKRRHKRRYTKR